VVRGGPVRRTHDVRVRLTPDEHAAWTAARDQTGRRELGAWVRVAINEMLSLPPGDRPGRGRVLREQPIDIDVALYTELIRVANDIYQLARQAQAEHRYPAEQQALATYEQVREAVIDIRAAIAASYGIDQRPPRTRRAADK
jgi:hypothetical protein